jgi:hypothetical protein
MTFFLVADLSSILFAVGAAIGRAIGLHRLYIFDVVEHENKMAEEMSNSHSMVMGKIIVPQCVSMVVAC